MRKIGRENEAYVYVDYESSGVWVPTESGGFGMAEYEDFGLPEELIRRFDYWTKWFSDRHPEINDQQNNPDTKLFEAYGLSLAIELKLFLKDSYRVFYLSGMRKSPPEIVLIKRDYNNDLVPIIKR